MRERICAVSSDQNATRIWSGRITELTSSRTDLDVEEATGRRRPAALLTLQESPQSSRKDSGAQQVRRAPGQAGKGPCERRTFRIH